LVAANLLINNRGILQIADFGLARHYDGATPAAGVYPIRAVRDYTCLVVTRWYRPPELLLQLRRYTTAIDMWGAGYVIPTRIKKTADKSRCVFGEMFKRKPILTGQSDLHQAQIIFELLGSPSDKQMPGWEALPGAAPFRNLDPKPGNVDRVFGE
jgi:serine/threonine-protein kinase BUR1